MPADRLVPTSLSSPPVTGPDFMDATQEELTGLWNAVALPLSSIGGTANAVTAAVTPALTGGILAGMAFWLEAGATNTAAMTLAIGGSAARALNTDAGSALGAGQIVAGRTYLILAGAADYRVLASSNIQKVTNFQKFTASGTWTKPTGCPADALVIVEAVGAGGGGHSTSAGAGGGGGAFKRRVMRAGDLPATVAVTVPAGGAIATAGASTTFGGYLTAYGGGRGYTSGGGGAGAFGPGANGVSGATAATAAGGPDGGVGAWGTGADAGKGAGDGTDGGGGGGSSTASYTYHDRDGGRSARGGGGGGGATGGLGGLSLEAGSGGNAGAAGGAPGGGGGTNAPGGRGECRVWTIG